MEYTREQLIAEAKRRGLPIPEQKPQYSRQQLEAEAIRRGLIKPKEQGLAEKIYRSIYEPSLDLGNLGAALTGFETPFSEVTHGALQPILESGMFGKALKRGSEEVGRERQQRYHTAMEESPISTGLGELTGTIARDLPAIIASQGMASRALGPGYLRYLAPLLGGMVGGGATGALKYTNPEESRLSNALKEGAIGGALGSAGAAAGKLIGGTKDLAQSFLKTHPAEKFAKRILSNKENLRNVFNQRYTDFENEAINKGINTIKFPRIKDSLIRNSDPELRDALKSALSNPNFKNVIEAEKGLTSLISGFQKSKEMGRQLSPAKLKTWRQAIAAKNKINKNISDSFSDAGHPELKDTYSVLKKDYKTQYIPYRNKNIGLYEAGKRTPEDFVNELSSNKQFKAELGLEEYPELYKSAALRKLGEGALSLPGVGLGYGLSRFGQ